MTQKKLSAYGKIILRGTRDNWQLSGFILTSVLKSIELFIPGGWFFFLFFVIFLICYFHLLRGTIALHLLEHTVSNELILEKL